jgi:phage terminase large subunit
MIQDCEIYMPQKAQDVLSAKARYKVLRGGRGGGKSYSFADASLAIACHLPKRILCTREMQNSIRDSVHRLLRDRISALGLDDLFTVQRESITSKAGAEFLFKGLHHNISDIKSTEGIDICWVEEAEKVSDDSWTVLGPTVRKEDSEIWVSFNPEEEKSATYQRFVVNPPDDCAAAELIYSDNKHFPEVLRREMEYDKRVDFEKYEHVWLGKIKRYSEACVFRNKVFVEEFETPDDVQFFHGADFGFSVDPTVLVRMFIQDQCLYIDYEAFGHGVEIDELEGFFKSVPTAYPREYMQAWEIIADSERPDTISHLARRGFNIRGAEKGKGSVEDGIQFLRSFHKIIIHPRCPGSADNFLNYKWKTDRISGQVLPIPAEGSDHAPDACRYALEPYVKSKATIFDVF